MNVIFCCHHFLTKIVPESAGRLRDEKYFSINVGEYKQRALSALHLLAEKDGRALREPELDLAALLAAARSDEEHAAADIALGDDGDGDRNAEFIVVGADGQSAVHAKMAVGDTLVHDLTELETHALVGKLALAGTRYRNDGVAVADDGSVVGGFFKALAKLLCKVGQLPDRRVFLENQLSVLIGEYLQRVTLTDSHRATDFFRYNHSPKVVNSSHNTGCFHIFVSS